MTNPGSRCVVVHWLVRGVLESRARLSAEPGPLHLTQPGDALELDLPDPDLADYDRHLDTENTP